MKLRKIIAFALILCCSIGGIHNPISFENAAKAEYIPFGTTIVQDSPEDIFVSGEWLYWIEGNYAIIAGYSNYSELALKVPEHLGGYSVVGIGHHAFSNNTMLSSIQVHNNVTRIADDAFISNTNITIKAYNGSFAIWYAQKNGISHINLSNSAQQTLADGVIDMAGAPSKAFSKLSEDGVLFSTDDTTFIQEGSIVFFPSNTRYPTGLAKKVLSIDKSSKNGYSYFTQPEFAEVFVELHGTETAFVDWSKARFCEGVTLDDVSASDVHSFTTPVKAGISLNLFTLKLSSNFSVNGKVGLSVGPATIKYDIGLQDFRPYANYLQVDIPVTTTKDVSLKFKYGVLDPSKGEGRIIKRVNISPEVPFASIGGVINGYLSVDMLVDVTGEIKFCATTQVVHTFKYKNGKASYTKSEDTKNSSFEINGQIKVGPELHVYFVLGWSGFSIRFFEVTAGIFAVIDSSYKSTQVTGNISELHCMESSLKAQFSTGFKIGIIMVFNIPGIYASVTPYEYNSNPIIKGHFEQGRLIKECTLYNRNVIFEMEKNRVYTSLKCNVNQRIPEPSKPTKQGYGFEGWYINAAKSGLGGKDYRFNFSTMRMPYISNQGTLYMYASWRDLNPVTSITLNKTSITGYSNMSVTDQLTTTSILPTNANNKAVRWESSNNNVATVDNNGLVRLMNAGTAIVSCVSIGNPAVRATCTVNVKQSVTGIAMNTSNIFRYSDNMTPVQLNAAVQPNSAVDKSIVWSSDNPSVAEVSNTGIVTLKALGTANISCRSVQNPNVVAVCPVAVRQAVTGITLDRESQLRTNADMSPLRLYATIEPSNAYNKTLSWESSNPSVAAVSDNGTITMKGVGTTIITCRSVSNPGITDSFSLEIIQAVTEITLNERSITHYSDYKDSIQLIPTIKPSNAGNKNVTWESSDPGVITVSSNGTVNIVAAGKAMVTCRSVSNPDVVGECQFTVLQAVTGITLNITSINTISDEINVTYLLANVEPENAANKAVTWKSSDDNVATVTNDGVVTIKGVGDAEITCRSVSQTYISATCAVHVELAVTDISLNEYSIFRYSSQTDDVQLIATLTASDLANKEVRWSTDNANVATVSDGGIVSFHGVGEAVITCTSVSNPDVHAECKVTIRQSVTEINLNETAVECESNRTEPIQLIATVLPSNAANKDLLWKSSNENVTVVSDSGVVTITGAGNALITCQSVSDPGITATCSVTVHQAVTSLSLNYSNITRYTNETGEIQLIAYIQPSFAENKEVSWTSSNAAVAEVSDNGEVVINNTGEAVITCRSDSNTDLYAECVILVKQAVSSISLNYTTLELLTNATDPVQLRAEIQPDGAEDKELTWTSSDLSVVVVSEEGKVSIVGTGNAVITCQSASNPNAQATCTVSVKQAVSSIMLSETAIECYNDESGIIRLSAVVQPINAENKNVHWESSDPNTVSVSANGILTINRVGTAKITCSSAENPDISAQCSVIIKQSMTGISLNHDVLSLFTDDNEGQQLTASITPSDTDDTAVYWESDNSSVAIVSDSGLVKAQTQGNAHIFCRSARNPETVYASCQVDVKQRVQEIHVEGETSSLLPGETLQLSASCYPESADDKTVVWGTDEPMIAVVDSNGLVTAVNYGTAIITATASDGSMVKGTYKVNVDHELVLITDVENDTVYSQGEQDVTLAIISASNASVRRIAESGNVLAWSLSKDDENDDVEIDVITTTVTDRGRDYKSSYVVLHGSSFKTPGTKHYTVCCTAGSLSATVEIPVTVDGYTYAQGVSLSPSTYEISVGESVLIPNMPISEDNNPLPAYVHLSYIEGDNNTNQHATFEEMTEGYNISFDESGIYTAKVFYDACNIVYDIAISFYVYDENGIVRIKSDSVSLDKAIVDLVEGEECKINASVLPIDAFDTTVTWISTDESVAIVDNNGLVTAVGSGKTAIVCNANDGSGAYGMCAVNVEKFLQLDDSTLEYSIYTTGNSHTDLGIVNVTFDSEKRVSEAGLNVTWKLEKISGTSCDIGIEEFRAKAEEGITVSGNLIKLLRIHDMGITEYMLTCQAGSFCDSCIIRINTLEAELPENISLVKSEYSGMIDDYIDIDTSYNGVTLPDDTIVSIEGGRAFENALSPAYDFTDQRKLIFALPGTYTANVVFSGDNYRYSCPISIFVEDKDGVIPVNISDVNITPEEVNLMVGEQITLSASIEPEEAHYGQLTWSSSDTNVVSVSSEGQVTAIGAGLAFVSVTVPESDFSGGCVVVVEDGLTLQTDSIDRTIFLDGITRTALDVVQLTAASSQRLGSAPKWELNRVSGNNLTLKAKEYNTVDSKGNTIYGCSIILYSLSREGDTEYELVCSAGEEEVIVPVSIHAVSRERDLPSALSFEQKEFTAEIDELLTISPEIMCLPEGTSLPDGMRVSLEGNDLFDKAINVEDYCVSQNMTTLSFRRAGRFDASFIYSYSNMRYAIPVTFKIKDDAGNVPVLSTSVSISSTSVWLVEGETTTLAAVFTPSNADNQNVTWSSTDTSVVTVDEAGNVKATGVGDAFIICEPADSTLSNMICSVHVEDFITIETDEVMTRLYKQGEQRNEIFGASLSEGTKLRLAKEGIKAKWDITRIHGNHCEIVSTVPENNESLIAYTSELISAGCDEYRITCTAGEHVVTSDFAVEVVDLDNIPEYITPMQTKVSAAIGESVIVDFSPVCYPEGSVLPKDDEMWSLYSGIGNDYQKAIDHNSYAENGNFVTLRFLKEGRYLFTRQFFLANLHYEQVCEINIGNLTSPLNLLKADTTDALVYMGGKMARIAEISITDSLLQEVFNGDVNWSLDHVSGDSMTAIIKPKKNGAELYAVNTSHEGDDIWKVTCSFGDYSDSIDIKVNVKQPRSRIPERIELADNHITGKIGDWLEMPIATKCYPDGASLPESGDDFWTFEPTGMANDVCNWLINDGILRVKVLWPGYYTGVLKYNAGNFAYAIPVYVAVTDEEGVLAAPQMDMFLTNVVDEVYMDGQTGVPIATAVVGRGMGSYYSGEASAYLEAHQGSWDVSIISGSAASLSIEPVGNTARVILNSLTDTGVIQYSVELSVENKVYTQTEELRIVEASAERPDPTLTHSVYYGRTGELMTIPTTVYDRGTGTILQSASKWNPDDLLPVIGYEYTETEDKILVTFYEKGTYTSSLNVNVGNLSYEVPFTIRITDTPATHSILKIPHSLSEIAENAFEECSVEVVDLRGTRVASIGTKAFCNCLDLTTIYIPPTVSYIASDAFYGCINLTIVCERNSKADAFASEHNIPVRYE